MKKYYITYEIAYGFGHYSVYAHNKKEARRIFNNGNKPISGSRIVDIEEA